MKSDDANIYELYVENAAANEQPKMTVDEQGTKLWYLRDELHRVGAPAVEYANGHKDWYLHGKRHREDGPAREYANGSKHWYLHGERHREDGPAVDNISGHKEWWLHGNAHREDGAAVELANGNKDWYLNNKRYDDVNAWARDVLKLHNKPHDDADVNDYLRDVLMKDDLI
jgi:hypothetical protein